jgi:hypothetical protein
MGVPCLSQGTIKVNGCEGSLRLPLLPPSASSAAKALTVTVKVPVHNVVTVDVGVVSPAVNGTLIVGWPLIATW